MDPNENLRKQREIVAKIRAGSLIGVALEEKAIELVDFVEAMDTWLVNGGFLPAAWQGDDE